jgi:hypothetical protein
MSVLPGNLWDLLRSILPILLLWQYDSRVLQTFIAGMLGEVLGEP